MNTIKFSAPDWCFLGAAELPVDEYYRKLKELGFSAVEMVAPERWDAARNAGLKILNMGGPGMENGLNNPDNHSQLIPAITEAIKEADAQDIEQVIVFSGNRQGIPDETGMDNCYEGIGKILPVAEKHGVTLIFEMLNSFDHADYQADSSAFGFSLAKKFDSPNFKLLYDVYHMQRMGEDVIMDISENIMYIGHMHAAAAPGRNCPGMNDEIDYDKVFKAATAVGYKGFWGMEFLPQNVIKELEHTVKQWKSFAAK